MVGDIWRKTVEVQQHLNDLELRIRNYAVTILAAILGVAAYAVKETLQIGVFRHRISVAAATLVGAIIPWLTFYFMDRFWYHRLLYGAVAQGKLIEDRWKDTIPEISLTEAIGRYSPLKFFRWKIHCPRKIDLFYGAGVFLLLVLSLLAQYAARPVADNSPSNKPAQVTTQGSKDVLPRLTSGGGLNNSPKVEPSQAKAHSQSTRIQAKEKSKQ